jgi:hypothetical protein
LPKKREKFSQKRFCKKKKKARKDIGFAKRENLTNKGYKFCQYKKN